MKNLINFILRFLVKIALHGYFRKIIVTGKKNIPTGVPVILVANHQNALIDPLLLATHTKLNPWFLTRAAVFKNPIAAKILHLIRMLPVYRVRDGFSTIQQNQKTFEATFEVLKKNGAVIIFAEGSHSVVRNVRPLSKGFTRMAFGLKEKYPNCEPVILPVALEYSAHKHSGSLVRITFGDAIPVDMPASKSGLLTKTVEKTLKSMVVEIPDEHYEENLNSILEAGVDVTSKEAVDNFLKDGIVINEISDPSGVKNKLMKIFNFPLYWIWLWISPKIQDRVFESTFKFLIGFFLGPIWFLMLFLLALSSPLGSWALAFLIMSLISILWNKSPQE